MTISTTSSSILVAGNSSLTSFAFPFIGAAVADISVSTIGPTGVQNLLLSNYSVTLNAATTNQLWGVGGQVIYPLVGSPLATGSYLLIQRTIPYTQSVAIQNQGNVYPQVTEQALDLLEMQIQQIAARTSLQRGVWASGVQYGEGDIVVDGVNGANTGNYYACVIQNLSTVWATDLAAGDWTLVLNVQIIAGYAASAAASAVTATTEAGIATTEAAIATAQASTATTQAGIATTQATNAAASASTATTQATNAASSASSASSSASTAATQATNAASSASSASTSASTATTQAGISTAQAVIATTQATNAAASAVAAGSTLTSTSTTSNTIGTGNFTFTTQANKNYQPGQFIIAASAANGTNYIHGYVASYSGTTLVITETDNSGSGVHADWNISVTGSQGPSGGGTGTVTTASVVSANGFAGTVANPTTTPAITLTTSITGVLKGNGTAISAATAGTDYLTVLSGGVTTAGNVATVVTNANLTGDVTSAGNATTLATVNSNVGSFTAANITVNGKGLVTAASNGSAGVRGNTYQVTDSTDITLSAAPTQSSIGSTKSISVPTKGMIELYFNGELIVSGSIPNGLVIGIRIGSTNYFATSASGVYLTAILPGVLGTFVYTGWGIDPNLTSAATGGPSCVSLSIEGLSIPTGTQTIQVVVAKSNSNGLVIKGTVVTSIINIVTVDCS